MASQSIPTVDFSGLDPNNPGTPAWESAVAQVREAMESVGFFSARLDEVGPDLRDELFGPAAKALFSLPLEVKQRNRYDELYGGYVGRRPGVTYEMLTIDEPSRQESVQAFTNLMWPQGNPAFCDTVWSFVKQLSKLDLMVRRTVLESLGVGKLYESQVESMKQTVRIIEYLEPEDKETMITLGEHKDLTLASIVYQHQKEGLELLSKDGRWLRAPPDTFTIMLGETIEALSNGRYKPALHRVRMTDNESRYSIAFGSQYKDGLMIEAPEELVDEEHPKLFKPYEPIAYTRFRFSEEGMKAKHCLKAYCGVNGDE